MTPKVPNPGSFEARAAGCKCPTVDNNHGRFPVWSEPHMNEHFVSPGAWWISSECTLHHYPLAPSSAEGTPTP